MSRPPLRRGLDPLIRIGVVKMPLSRENDDFFDFLVFCETIFREHEALKNQLEKCKVDPEEFLRHLELPPGSIGRHRLVFDGWYIRIAKALQSRLSKPEDKKSV